MAHALGDYDVFKAEAFASPVFEMALFIADLGREMNLPTHVSVLDHYGVFLCEDDKEQKEDHVGPVDLVHVQRFHPTLLKLKTTRDRARDKAFIRGAAQAIDQKKRDMLFHTISVSFNPNPAPHPIRGRPVPPRNVIMILAPRAVLDVAARVLKTTVSDYIVVRASERKEDISVSISCTLYIE